MIQQRTVDAAQRRAELVIATLFLLTAAASIPAAFVLDPILNAPTTWPGFFRTREPSNCIVDPLSSTHDWPIIRASHTT